jgi:hypothetical protein
MNCNGVNKYISNIIVNFQIYSGITNPISSAHTRIIALRFTSKQFVLHVLYCWTGRAKRIAYVPFREYCATWSTEKCGIVASSDVNPCP